MTIAQPILWPFNFGNPVSLEVPTRFPVAIGGRPFLLDLKSDAWEYQTIPPIRPQQDASSEPSGASLNPQGLWFRATNDWSHGAGQTYLDRPASDRARFRSSKGADIWTPHQVSLLPDTFLIRSNAAAKVHLCLVGDYLYAAYGTELWWTLDLDSWTAVNIQDGEGAQPVLAICTDGHNVYAALGSNGVHVAERGDTSAAHVNDLEATLIAFVNGRLMAAQDSQVFNITDLGSVSPPLALAATSNTDFTWVGFTSGPSAIYAAGYSGSKSLVYRVALTEDGTELDAFIVAGELQPGEIVSAIASDLRGYLEIGIGSGWRLVTLNDNGDMANTSDPIPTPGAVQCFSSFGHFIYYGLSDYDGDSTGLGRADPGVFTKGLDPAYASDVMATGQGAVTSVVTFLGRRVFGVGGLGVFMTIDDLVPSGSIDSGLLTFDIADEKVSMFLDVRYSSLAGSFDGYLSTDGNTFAHLGTRSVGDPKAPFLAGQRRGGTFESRVLLARSALDTTSGPVVTQTTVKVNPVIDSGEFIILPLLISDRFLLDNETEVFRDPADDMAYIRTLRRDRSVTTCQIGSAVDSVTVEDFDFKPNRMVWRNGRMAPIGTCLVKAKTIPEAAGS